MSESTKDAPPPAVVDEKKADEKKADEKAARTTAEADITKYKARPLAMPRARTW
jgi:hypothetical protein